MYILKWTVLQEAIASYERCLELVPGARNAAQNKLLALNYTTPGEEPSVCRAHADFGASVQREIRPLPPLPLPDDALDPDRCPAWLLCGCKPSSVLDQGRPRCLYYYLLTLCLRERLVNRQITVGYVSPDLFQHSVSYFAEAPLTHHDPDRYVSTVPVAQSMWPPFACVPFRLAPIVIGMDVQVAVGTICSIQSCQQDRKLKDAVQHSTRKLDLTSCHGRFKVVLSDKIKGR